MIGWLRSALRILPRWVRPRRSSHAEESTTFIPVGLPRDIRFDTLERAARGPDGPHRNELYPAAILYGVKLSPGQCKRLAYPKRNDNLEFGRHRDGCHTISGSSEFGKARMKSYHVTSGSAAIHTGAGSAAPRRGARQGRPFVAGFGRVSRWRWRRRAAPTVSAATCSWPQSRCSPCRWRADGRCPGRAGAPPRPSSRSWRHRQRPCGALRTRPSNRNRSRS